MVTWEPCTTILPASSLGTKGLLGLHVAQCVERGVVAADA
jgi:hypothetical protein